MENEIYIIADNGGGITMQITDADGYKYQHYYCDISQCAGDIKSALAGDSASGWDGNEISDWLIPSGIGYKTMIVESLADLADWSDSSWGNCRSLAKETKK